MNNKIILVLSPQAWGKMMLAKHHYALELAKAGNQVYFLNPPDNSKWTWQKSSKRIRVKKSELNSNLFIIDQELYFPYILKYHARTVYNILVKKQIRDILHVIGKRVDIVWSFDLGNLFPIRLFPNYIYKIFHPVDEPGDQHAIRAAAGAGIMFSVTHEILDKYASQQIPSFFINHGLADEFFSEPAGRTSGKKPIHVGMSGNLLRQDLDRDILLHIVKDHPDLIFHFYGSHKITDSNIGAGTDEATRRFIDELTSLQQVRLHGVLKTADLARELNSMDVLLICYDIEKDQSKGTNYHKVMEYLSTGKVIVSNNITTYKNRPDLVRMPEERSTNQAMPALFTDTIENLRNLNGPELAKKRMSFARENSYGKQISEIDQFIERTIKRAERAS